MGFILHYCSQKTKNPASTSWRTVMKRRFDKVLTQKKEKRKRFIGPWWMR